MGRRGMKTHHLANFIFVLVLLTAVIGVYYIVKAPGRAIELTTEIETPGKCLCQDKTTFVKTALKPQSELLQSDCVAICQESNSRALIV
jgi:hypothetical protein